ncbi:protein OS-9 [Pogoniulus pusillus]|uniref:protein OS-9 n=1 Tax=Pogoniulus pusillus TaxID=488313 RepID=UPI0030B96507
MPTCAIDALWLLLLPWQGPRLGLAELCPSSLCPALPPVQFLCEEGAGDYLARVDEPQSCSYVLTVHTPRLCHHPFLRPPASAAPQPILCQPALSPAQYVQYVRAQVSDTKRKVEEISEELRTLDSRVWSERDSPGHPPAGTVPAASDVPAPARDELDPAKEVAFWQRVREVTSKGHSQQDSAKAEEPTPKAAAGAQAADARRKIHFKVIRSPGDLLQFIEELKESTKKAKEKVSKEEEEEETAAATKASPPHPVPEEPPAGEKEEEEEEEEDGDLLGGFEKELEAVLLPREQMAQLKEEVKTEMEKEFDNIINEVEDELEGEGLKGEFDRTQASKSLASTLHRLMDKLDGGGPSPAPEREEEEEEEEEGAGRKGTPSPAADNRLRVRVSRVGAGSAPQQEPPPRRDSAQLQHIESEVRELLAKEGLRAEGKIEIKIVRAGGGEEEEGQWLSEEDTKSLKEIFLSILIQGTEEAQQERRRQQALEANYRFVWGGREEPPPPADAEDSDF